MDAPLTFECGRNLISLTEITSGVMSSHDLCETVKDFNHVEDLKSYSLSEAEIKIYLDLSKGMEYVYSVHKNIEKNILHQMIQEIKEKVKHGKECSSSSKTLKPKLIHPIHNLHELEDDIFGHMDIDKLPSANKRRKFIRRMERKLSRPIEVPETNLNSTVTQNPNHSYDDFVTFTNDESSKTNKKNCNTNVANSKWDIRTQDNTSNVPAQKRLAEMPTSKRKIGCSSQTLYTIKNNKIVRLEATNANKSSVEYKTSDIKLPINKAEEKLLEGTRLDIEDIKKIPKFKNYSPGQPSNVLFIKNLSNNIKSDDLKSLFDKYQNHSDVRLMTGKMRGQAFITFDNLNMAVTALHEKNGTILKGKPIIIQFGKRNSE